MMNRKRLTLLAIIIAVGLFLRAWRVGGNPPALNWDEASHGYNAYSLLRTGKDEWGTRSPLLFRAYGDYKLPLYIYLTIIPVWLWGLNPFSVRFISVLSGVGLVFVAYLLGKETGGDKKWGLLSAFLTAVSPWGLFLSRVAVEANLAAFLFSLGSYFFYRWLKQEKRGSLGSSFFLWGLSLHAYNSARVLAPIFFLIALGMGLKKKGIKKTVFPGLIFLLFFIPVVFQFFNSQGEARFFWVSPLDQGAINKIIEKRQASRLPLALKRAIYNRPVYFFTYSFVNYWRHFSPQFLFFKGGSHYQFSFPEHGILYLVTAPFLLIGIGSVFLRKEWFLGSWFLLAFLPSAITRDAPHVLRSILILPLPAVFTSLGVKTVEDWLKRKSGFGGRLLLLTFGIGVLISFVSWWQNYWQIYRSAYSWAWQYGYKEAVAFAKENYSHYDRIVFTKKYGEPHEFVLFYWPWEPAYYQNDPKKIWDYHAHWYWVDVFDKFQFWNDWEVKEKLKTQNPKLKARGKNLKLLLITSPRNWIRGGKLLKTVYFLDGSPAFEIVEY